jgi:hypothetical protein
VKYRNGGIGNRKRRSLAGGHRLKVAAADGKEEGVNNQRRHIKRKASGGSGGHQWPKPASKRISVSKAKKMKNQ